MIERLRAAAATIFRDSPVLVAYAHGSRLAGRPRPGSDLDVGYYLARARGGRRISLREEMRLAGALSEAIEIEVDLRDLTPAPLELRGRVLEEGLRIYSAGEPERVALERDLLARYHDYKDAFARMHDLRLRALAHRGL